MNDTDTIFNSIWQTLGRAVHDAKHDWHWPVLGTVDSHLQPQLRTVVLRQYHREDNWLEIHTDSRADKIHQLSQSPKAALLFYDSRYRTQVRVDGIATIHHQDSIATDAWAKLGNHGQAQYQLSAAPATPLAQAAPTDLIAQETNQFFSVIRISVEQMDWLRLSRGGHERVQFKHADKTWTNTVLVA